MCALNAARISSRSSAVIVPSAISRDSKRAIGSFFAHSSNRCFGHVGGAGGLLVAAHPECLELQQRRSLAAPRPRRPRGSPHRRPRARRCHPPSRRPSRSRPRDRTTARSAYCSTTGVDRPHWLFSTTKITGSFQTAARFSASWKSPSLVAPSPVKVAATRGSPAQLIGQGEPVGHRRHRPEVADHPDDVVREDAEMEGAVAAAGEAAVAAQQLAEQRQQVQPAGGEDARDSDASGGWHRPRRKAAATPTAIASCPMPENHLDSRPCRSRISIFSSISRGNSSAR